MLQKYPVAILLLTLAACASDSDGGSDGNTDTVDPCAENPCLNEGVCYDLNGAAACDCPAGYDGDLCGSNIDDCADTPCANGGTCVDGIDGFTCTCPAGFGGDRCDTNIDDCSPNPCENGGACADGVDSFSCTCAAGFSGDTCATNIDDCAAEPCLNGGTCTDGVDGYTCSCATGFEGDTCATNIDDCVGDPCLNGGVCSDAVAGFTCACAAGFEGATCATDTDDCADNPCANGGTCTDAVDGFSCSCAPGFAGLNCEVDLDDCVDDPCLNGGECTDAVNSFVCTCADGWEGDTCASNIDDCPAQDPCVIGSCIDAHLGFSCDCAQGWSGDRCDEDVDECASETDDCDLDETCINNMGAFTCEAVMFVDPSAGDGGDGSTWELAFNSFDAAFASAGTEFWVKSGTFSPAEAQASVLVVPGGVRLFGGFAAGLSGRAGDRSSRDLVTHVTSLNGDFDGSDGNDSVHVVTLMGDGITLDGFRVEHGRALGEGNDGLGAGVFGVGLANVTLGNLNVINNVATAGGGIGVIGSAIRLENSSVMNNSADVGAGAAFVDTDVSVIDTTLESNVATGLGGGVSVEGGSASIVGSTVASNSVGGNGPSMGGGIAALDADVQIIDSQFTANVATGGSQAPGTPPAGEAIGGGMYYVGDPTQPWSGVVFDGNSASGGTGAALVGSPHGANGGGGGLAFSGVAAAPWEDISFIGNAARAGHGAVGTSGFNFPGTCFPATSGGNGGVGRGGGLWLLPGSDLSLTGGTNTGNEVHGGSGGGAGGGTTCGGPPAVAGIPGGALGGGLFIGEAVLSHDFSGEGFADNVPSAFRPCEEGFEGYLCNDNIDDCVGDPCGPNGQCADLLPGYECICDIGWDGAACEIDVDEDDCAQVTCANPDELCIDGNGVGTCTPVVMVDASATGSNDGSTWENAFTSLFAAMNASPAIWVKVGTYAADGGPALTTRPKVRIYGGFAAELTGRAGEVASRQQRSVLDGTNTNRGLVVARHSVVDGFIITNGSSHTGGGVLVDGTAGVKLRNLRIEGNEADSAHFGGAGGLWCNNSIDLSLEDVDFINNVSIANIVPIGGGALFHDCEATVVGGTVSGNSVVGRGTHAQGAGFAIRGGDVALSSVTFTGNMAVAGDAPHATGTAPGLFVRPNGNRGPDGFDAYGGGIFLAAQISTPWTGIVISGNTTESGAGGNGSNGGNGTQVDGPSFTTCGIGGSGGNGGRSRGAGLWLADDASVELQGGSVTGNSAIVGGGGAAGQGGIVPNGAPPNDYICPDGAPGGSGHAWGGGIYGAVGTFSWDGTPSDNLPDNIGP